MIASISGVSPQNQASTLLFVVPVFPAISISFTLALRPVPFQQHFSSYLKPENFALHR